MTTAPSGRLNSALRWACFVLVFIVTVVMGNFLPPAGITTAHAMPRPGAIKANATAVFLRAELATAQAELAMARSTIDTQLAALDAARRDAESLRTELMAVRVEAAQHIANAVVNMTSIASSNDVAMFPCACSDTCTCGALFVISTITPQTPHYLAKYGGKRKPHLQLLGVAIRSFKKYNPDKRVAVFTDNATQLQDLLPFIDFIGPILNTQVQTKMYMEVLQSMTKSPWHKTIYFDADVIVCMPLDEIFDVLDHFDATAVRSRLRSDEYLAVINRGDVRSNFKYTSSDFFNAFSAVYGYRNSSSSRAIITRARELDESTQWDHMNNLFHAVEEVKPTLSFYALPGDFFYVQRVVDIPSYLTRAVRVVHGYVTCEVVNAIILPRIYDPRFGFLLVAKPRQNTSNWNSWDYFFGNACFGESLLAPPT